MIGNGLEDFDLSFFVISRILGEGSTRDFIKNYKRIYWEIGPSLFIIILNLIEIFLEKFGIFFSQKGCFML